MCYIVMHKLIMGLHANFEMPKHRYVQVVECFLNFWCLFLLIYFYTLQCTVIHPSVLYYTSSVLRHTSSVLYHSSIVLYYASIVKHYTPTVLSCSLILYSYTLCVYNSIAVHPSLCANRFEYFCVPSRLCWDFTLSNTTMRVICTLSLSPSVTSLV